MAGITNRQELDDVLVAGRESLAGDLFEEAARLLRLADESTFLDASEKPQLWYDIGAAAQGAGSPDAATSYFDAAMRGGNATVAASAKARLALMQGFDVARDEAARLGQQDEVAPSLEFDDVLAEADMAYNRGEYTGALELYTAAYNAPGDMKMKGGEISGLVWCLMALGRYDEARQYVDYARGQGADVDAVNKELTTYDTAHASASGGASASEFAGVKRAAIYAFNRRDYTGAAEFFRQLLDDVYVPGWGQAEISYNLGQCLLQLQDYDGARYYFEQADGKSTADVNQRTHALLQRLEHLDDALAVVEPHLVK